MIDKRNPAKVTNEEEDAATNFASKYDVVYECLGCGKFLSSGNEVYHACSKTPYWSKLEERIKKWFRCRRCGVVYGLLSDTCQCDHRVEGFK